MFNKSNPLSDLADHDEDTCADCAVALSGDDNASAYGDNLNVCDDCESKREEGAIINTGTPQQAHDAIVNQLFDHLARALRPNLDLEGAK